MDICCAIVAIGAALQSTRGTVHCHSLASWTSSLLHRFLPPAFRSTTEEECTVYDAHSCSVPRATAREFTCRPSCASALACFHLDAVDQRVASPYSADDAAAAAPYARAAASASPCSWYRLARLCRICARCLTVSHSANLHPVHSARG